MPNLLVAPQQQPFLKASPYFDHRIPMDTVVLISPSSDGNSYIYVIVDAFTQYVVLYPSTINDAAIALIVLFDHWIVKFEKPVIFNGDNGIERISGELTHFGVHIMYKLNQAHRMCHGQMD